MHPMTRRLASAPAEWLWQHRQDRTTCPARCDEGLVYTQTERASWEYPGAWEGRPCDRCGGLGYLPRVWRSGGNPDCVDGDRCRDYHDAGYYPDEAARMEMQHQQPRHEEPDYCDYGMEQHYEGGW